MLTRKNLRFRRGTTWELPSSAPWSSIGICAILSRTASGVAKRVPLGPFDVDLDQEAPFHIAVLRNLGGEGVEAARRSFPRWGRCIRRGRRIAALARRPMGSEAVVLMDRDESLRIASPVVLAIDAVRIGRLHTGGRFPHMRYPPSFSLPKRLIVQFFSVTVRARRADISATTCPRPSRTNTIENGHTELRAPPTVSRLRASSTSTPKNRADAFASALVYTYPSSLRLGVFALRQQRTCDLNHAHPLVDLQFAHL